MSTPTTGMERALGAIGTTFRMTRLYPPIHPALVEAVRQVTETLPALAALGTVEWKVGATGLHWQGQHLLPRNSQVAELAGLLFARGIRSIRADPGVAAEHILALFGVATGNIPADDASLGQLSLSTARRTQRLAKGTTGVEAPAIDIGAAGLAASLPPAPHEGAVRRATATFRPDVLPVDVALKRAVASLAAATTPEGRREAVATLEVLTPSVVALRDVGLVAEAVAAVDRLLITIEDADLVKVIVTTTAGLADKPLIARMISRLGEARVAGEERDALVGALGALAAVSVGLILNAYLAARTDMREPYRAVIRRAGERALEPLQGRLADTDPTVAAAAAELVGLSGAPQVVALLVPLLRHEAEFVREAALTGLAEIGGREISRPVMPALKDPSMAVRAAAARAIAVAGDLGATTVLVRRLEQEVDEAVLGELLRAIGRLGAPEALETLAKYAEPGGMLKRRSPTVRAAAVEGLARITSREARGLLELYTHDKEPTVRRAAEAAVR